MKSEGNYSAIPIIGRGLSPPYCVYPCFIVASVSPTMLRLTYSIFFQQKPIKPFASATRAMALCHLRDEGAEDYAVFYSLLESCDVVQLNPLDLRSYNFCHTNTKNPGNNLGIFCLITGRPKLNGYFFPVYEREQNSNPGLPITGSPGFFI